MNKILLLTVCGLTASLCTSPVCPQSATPPSTGQGAAGAVTVVPAPSRTNAIKVETEVVEINDFGAAPSEIRRKAGQFFLLLVNHSRSKQTTLGFEAPGAAAGIASGATQALNLGRFQQLKYAPGLLDLPPGEYHLTAQATGKVLLKITIQ